MAASAKSEDGDMGFQIAPMVDVVFVLLLFFIAIASFKIREKELAISLLGEPGMKITTDPSVAVIDITEDGAVSANATLCGDETDRPLAGLRTWLAQARLFGDRDQVIIHPAPGTRQERIVDVLNACAAEKVKNVAFN